MKKCVDLTIESICFLFPEPKLCLNTNPTYYSIYFTADVSVQLNVRIIRLKIGDKHVMIRDLVWRIAWRVEILYRSGKVFNLLVNIELSERLRKRLTKYPRLWGRSLIRRC